jgi:hypothetical protein
MKAILERLPVEIDDSVSRALILGITLAAAVLVIACL